MDEESYKTPNWENANRCHDWKNHVPTFIKDEWHLFDEPTQLAMSKWAKELADEEEWD